MNGFFLPKTTKAICNDVGLFVTILVTMFPTIQADNDELSFGDTGDTVNATLLNQHLQWHHQYLL